MLQEQLHLQVLIVMFQLLAQLPHYLTCSMMNVQAIGQANTTQKVHKQSPTTVADTTLSKQQANPVLM